ncbi:MAG: hypothetical protein V1914_02640 [archaeon]
MPYVKLKNKSQEEPFHAVLETVIDDFMVKMDFNVPGRISLINDPIHGIVHFLSEEPYMKFLNLSSVEFEIVPKEEITSDYAKLLRETYPDYDY